MHFEQYYVDISDEQLEISAICIKNCWGHELWCYLHSSCQSSYALLPVRTSPQIRPIRLTPMPWLEWRIIKCKQLFAMNKWSFWVIEWSFIYWSNHLITNDWVLFPQLLSFLLVPLTPFFTVPSGFLLYPLEPSILD